MSRRFQIGFNYIKLLRSNDTPVSFFVKATKLRLVSSENFLNQAGAADSRGDGVLTPYNSDEGTATNSVH